MVQHAGAAIEQHREGERHLAQTEERHLLRLAVFHDREVVAAQRRHVALRGIRDRHMQGDEIDAAPEGRWLRRAR